MKNKTKYLSDKKNLGLVSAQGTMRLFESSPQGFPTKEVSSCCHGFLLWQMMLLLVLTRYVSQLCCCTPDCTFAASSSSSLIRKCCKKKEIKQLKKRLIGTSISKTKRRLRTVFRRIKMELPAYNNAPPPEVEPVTNKTASSAASRKDVGFRWQLQERFFSGAAFTTRRIATFSNFLGLTEI